MSIENENGPIVFGGLKYEVAAFTLDQLQRLAPALAQAEGKRMATGDQIGAAVPILAAALDKTEDEIRATKTDIIEVMAAVDRIAFISGLVRLGELLATAGQLPIGTSSMPPSSPTQDGAGAKSES